MRLRIRTQSVQRFAISGLLKSKASTAIPRLLAGSYTMITRALFRLRKAFGGFAPAWAIFRSGMIGFLMKCFRRIASAHGLSVRFMCWTHGSFPTGGAMNSKAIRISTTSLPIYGQSAQRSRVSAACLHRSATGSRPSSLAQTKSMNGWMC